MIYPELFGEQIKIAETVVNSTRSNKILIPIHSNIAKYIQEHSQYQAISLPDKEYEFKCSYGTKKIDIAILKNNKLVGAILFKGIRSEYNKNANNYYEQMKGESSLFIDNNIPVYQIIFIPTKVRHTDKNKGKIFETPTEKSYNNYKNFIAEKPSYWNLLKLGVYYFDVDYSTYKALYSSEKTIPGVESTISEGLNDFLERISKYDK